MILREAVIHDSQWLLDIRNDPRTREVSFQSDMISFEDHERWFYKSLYTSTRRIWIAEEENQRIGMVRLDLISADEAEVSINIDPKYRGRGLGCPILDLLPGAAERWNPNIFLLKAQTKASNTASIRLFEKAGYMILNRDENRVEFQKELAATKR